MPSGGTHDRITLWSLPLVTGATIACTRDGDLALLLAGIVGNLIDRVRLGEVVDFLDFHWGDRFTWPTFNLADAAICIGAALLAIELAREERMAHFNQSQSPAAAEESGGSD